MNQTKEMILSQSQEKARQLEEETRLECEKMRRQAALDVKKMREEALFSTSGQSSSGTSAAALSERERQLEELARQLKEKQEVLQQREITLAGVRKEMEALAYELVDRQKVPEKI